MSSARRSSCSRPRAWPMTSSRHAWTPLARSSASGASVSTTLDYLASRRSLEAGGQPAFPPSVVVEVKALACELPRRREVPLARWSVSELRREVVAQGVVAQISGTTLWRWLSQDALRPWRYRSWIFPRDPHFAFKAGRILDLYERRWQGVPLGPREYVLCADEKTSIQARRRRHPSQPPAPGRARVHSRRRLGLYRRLGCASRAGVRALRSEDRHRALRPARRAGHEAGTVSLGSACLLDHGQRFLSSGPPRRRAAAGQVAEARARPHPHPRQLAQ